MQLDKTRIAIRERSVTDIFDLALHVMRVYFRPFFLAMFVGALPFMLFNGVMLGWLVHVDFGDIPTEDVVARSARFMWTMALLVAVEAPAASLLATVWLGHAVFMDRPPWRTVVRNVIGVLPRFAWTVLVLRGVIPVLAIAASISPGDYSGQEFTLALLAGLVILVRGARPFMNEIVLLERNPLRASGPGAMTIGRRSALLHGARGNALVYQAFVSACYATLLSFALFAALPTLRGILLDRWTLGPKLIEFGWPLVLWFVAGFMTMVRFLQYLDLRIRQEGWEVELRMRAAGARIAATLAERGSRARIG